jgi:hypothetical protein
VTADCFQTDLSYDDIGKWNFIKNQKIYEDSAATGPAVGVLLAFLVILLATRSLIVATTTATSIACALSFASSRKYRYGESGLAVGHYCGYSHFDHCEFLC